LLHIFQEKEAYEHHDPLNHPARARLITATTRNLRQEAIEGKFRPDLFYRLAVITLEVPPLRERREDLLPIANYLRLSYSAQFAKPDKPFPQKLIERMQHYEWPGNIRELEAFVCRHVTSGGSGIRANKMATRSE
jgi:DNA-binding NtrC family response regulator